MGYVFLVNLAVNLLYIPMLWREFRRFRFKLDLVWLQPLLKYAYPLMFMGLAGMVNEVIDRILLKEWLPENFYPGTEQPGGGRYLWRLLQTFHFHDAYRAGFPLRSRAFLLFAKPG